MCIGIIDLVILMSMVFASAVTPTVALAAGSQEPHYSAELQSLECLSANTNPYLTQETEKMTYAYHQAHHVPTETPHNLKGKLNINFLDRRFILSGSNSDWRQGSDSLMTCAEVGAS